jgi:hypothetical protein
VTKNRPIKMRDLLAAVQRHGILVPGKNPGTTLGAILIRRPEFEIVDREQMLAMEEVCAERSSVN